MKLVLFVAGLLFLAVGAIILKPIAKNLPDLGFADWLIGSVGVSFLLGGLRILWASFFVP